MSTKNSKTENITTSVTLEPTEEQLKIIRERWNSHKTPLLQPYDETCLVCGKENSTNLFSCVDCYLLRQK